MAHVNRRQPTLRSGVGPGREEGNSMQMQPGGGTASERSGRPSSTGRPAAFRAGLNAALVATATLVAGCADREEIAVPTDATGFTDRGWDFFTDGEVAQARVDFENAIEADPTFGPAYVGLGWAKLRLATSATEMSGAVQSFDDATARGQNGAEVVAGKAAAQLGVGGTAGLAAAVTLAQTARTQAPAFQFEHAPSFDLTDLFLIEAFARAAQGNLAQALAAADAAPVADSGIAQGNPATWQVDGTTYPTFEGAALAFLHKLSEEHAG